MILGKTFEGAYSGHIYTIIDVCPERDCILCSVSNGSVTVFDMSVLKHFI